MSEPTEGEWETVNERTVKWDKEQSRYLLDKLKMSEPLTPAQRAALVAAAKEATPGPWEKRPGRQVVAPCPCCGLIAECSQYGANPECSNADYIALANPAAVLALDAALTQALERAEAAEQEFADTFSKLCRIKEAVKTPDALFASQLECAVAENVRSLQAENARLRAAIELCAGSIRAFDEKSDDAPMSAAAHLEEALEAAEMFSVSSTQYSPAAANLRGEIRARIDARRALEANP